jgi:hypothetical protein
VEAIEIFCIGLVPEISRERSALRYTLKRLDFLLSVIVLYAAAAVAQQLNPVPPAPVPSLILAAKTIFISNNGDASGIFSGGADNLYNEFYASLKATGQFVLVSDPSQADLVLEPHFIDGANVRLMIYDQKTHFTLWTLAQPISPNGFQKTRDRKFVAGIAALVQQFERLAGKTAN